MSIKNQISIGEEIITFYNKGCFNDLITKYSEEGYKIYYPEDAILSCAEIEKGNLVAVEEYKANFQVRIYEQLIFLIGVIDKAKILEKEHIINQVNELIIIFFDYLDSDNDTYWQSYMTILNCKEYNDVVYSMKLKEFTKEYVLKIISKNSLPAANKEHDEDNDKSWFIAGLKFVDGTVYECKEVKKEGFTGEEFAKLVFSKKKQEENMSEIEFAQLISNTRGYIGDTINNKTRSLFKKTNKYESQWRKIYDYHKKQGGKIDSRFAEEFLKTYKVTIE